MEAQHKDPIPPRLAGEVSPQGHPWLGGLTVILALIGLLGPILAPIALWHLAPVPMESLVNRYTDLDEGFFRTARESGKALPPEARRFVRHRYLERAAVETLVRIWNPLGPGLGLAAVAVILAVAAHVAAIRLRPKRRWAPWAETTAFFLLFAGASWLWAVPSALVVATIATAIFLANFVLARRIVTFLDRPSQRLSSSLCVICTPVLAHLISPVFTLLCAARAIWPHSPGTARGFVTLGRAAACVIGFPVLILAFLSTREIPNSSQAHALLLQKDLYDVEVDPGANRVLVTTKHGGEGYILSLDPARPIGGFRFPTAEMEDIELDPERREIYHVDRATRTIWVVDADRFQERRSAQIPVPASGSTKLALVRSADRLVVSWENDFLVIVDRTTLRTEAAARTGNVNPLADEANGIVYLKPADAPVVEALNPRTLQRVARAPGPGWGERLALSPKRRELYAPDPTGGRIWVYATPNLEVLRKLPALFGVRALAIDDDHGLLLAASAITGYVDVIDLTDGKTLQHHYVGPYSRIIGLDPPRRQAFITITKKGLFLLRY
jgi:hypothetical protein